MLKRLAGIHNNDNTKLKKDLRQLVSLIFEYNILGKDKNNRGAFSFLSQININSKKGHPAIVSFSLPPMILGALPDPEMRVRLRFYIQRNLTSKYGLSLWEVLSDYKGLKTITIDMDSFRKLMGVADGSYTNMTMFRKKVVDVGVGEVNEKTDIEVQYELVKTGRKFTAITFTIGVREEESTLEDVGKKLVGKLKYYGYNEEQIRGLLKVHDEDYLLANIAVVEDYLEKGKTINDMKPYLSKAFREDFRRTESQYEKERKSSEKGRLLALEQVADNRDREQELKEQFQAYRKQLAGVRLAGLGEDELGELEERFIASVSNMPSMVKAYRE